MESNKVKRLWKIREKIKELKSEEEILKNEIKKEMIATNTEITLVDNIALTLKTQHRIQIDDQVIPYLKNNGYSYLILETCDQRKFKEMLNDCEFRNDYEYIKDYVKQKDIHSLYLKLNKK